jgi:Dak1 domain
MKKLINSPDTFVRESLEGLARAHPELVRVHFDPTFVYHADAPVLGKVALISGGGSGHEPMHGGYVGLSMLRQAQVAARGAQVSEDWIQADATRFAAPKWFDGAICLCEGSLGLTEEDEDPIAHDQAIACNLARSVRPGARLVLTASNGLRCLRKSGPDDVDRGTSTRTP